MEPLDSHPRQGGGEPSAVRARAWSGLRRSLWRDRSPRRGSRGAFVLPRLSQPRSDAPAPPGRWGRRTAAGWGAMYSSPSHPSPSSVTPPYSSPPSSSSTYAFTTSDSPPPLHPPSPYPPSTSVSPSLSSLPPPFRLPSLASLNKQAFASKSHK